MAGVEVLKTNKEGVKLVYKFNNFQYIKKKENNNGTITWKCCECSAQLRTCLAPDYRNPRVNGQCISAEKELGGILDMGSVPRGVEQREMSP